MFTCESAEFLQNKCQNERIQISVKIWNFVEKTSSRNSDNVLNIWTDHAPSITKDIPSNEHYVGVAKL